MSLSQIARFLACLLVFFASLHAVAQYEPPVGFYDSAVGTGTTLKSQLTSIMSSGHIQRTYGNFRFSVPVHDVDPSNPSNVLLVYNGASVDGTWDSGNTWNREHVWPQARQPGSASNSSQGNLGDPHALRPSNPAINSLRANKPFGFDDTIGSFSDLGSYFFPGDACKGDIARSIFYSATRWSSLGLTLTDNFPTGNQMGGLSSLVAWHYLDPPDEFEQRRNHTIYSSSLNPQYFTNNRNAYVDRPEFVWSVFVNQQNDSTISVEGGTVDDDGSSVLVVDFGSIIVGGTATANQTIVLNKSGMDGTYYSVDASGASTSELSGRLNAFKSNDTDSSTFDVGLNFNSAIAGMTSGLVTVNNLDVTTQGGLGHGANDGNDLIIPLLTILDHANASFSDSNDQDLLTQDLGQFELGESITPFNFEIHNLSSQNGSELTASLDLDSIDADMGGLTVQGQLFQNLVSGQNESFSISGTVNELGAFTNEFVFNLSDEDLSGAVVQSITLSISYEVVSTKIILGDVNCDGEVNLLDVAPFVELLSTGQFSNKADINEDGIVSLLDVEPFVALLSGS